MLRPGALPARLGRRRARVPPGVRPALRPPGPRRLDVEVQLNTLYVVTRGAVLRRDHLTIQVVVENQVRLTVPVHQLESVAAFGGVRVTPPVMGLCADRGVAVSFLSEAGRLLG